MTNEEITEIQTRNDYFSIAINEIKQDFFNENALFGHLGMYFKERYSNDEIIHIFNFLTKIGIFIINENNRYIMNTMFRKLFQKCHALINYLISFFKFIFSSIAKPNKDVFVWLENLFGHNFRTRFEILCREERQYIKKIKASENPFYFSYSGETLETKIKESLKKFVESLEIFENDFSIPIRDKEQRFVMTRILDFIFPNFIRKCDNFVIDLGIKSKDEYWLKNSLPYLWFEKKS